MSRIEVMRSRLEEAFQTSRFHSFLGSLKGVSDEAARWMPEHYRGFPHMDGSILNLAFHTGGDKHVLYSYSFGDGSITWPLMQSRFDSYGGDMLTGGAGNGHARRNIQDESPSCNHIGRIQNTE